MALSARKNISDTPVDSLNTPYIACRKKKGINGNLKYNVKLLQETQKTETTRSRNYQLFFKELHSKMKAKKFTLSTSTYEGSFVVLKRLQHKQSTQCAPQILN